MVNKDLNDSLSAHFDKVNSGETHKVKVRKEKKTFFDYVKYVKNYFFPPPKYEEATISGTALTIVKKVDHGIIRHIKQMLCRLIDLFRKKEITKVDSKKVKEDLKEHRIEKKRLALIKKKPKVENKPVIDESDIDISKINEVIEKNKI